ncbi:hypothetical protein [Colwellia sp. Bg11-28]|uniref:hypothetical protein n=1 Tax=Colwellia sp. Bg11-28 TaxID=2058305 RepID=UPI000C341F8D|nr:hypothetical protein [Colwellia sp. Bg11-28]PKH88904.1 hypothetical protein CXF79_03190 [Colwellia sp. Bg11-28]
MIQLAEFEALAPQAPKIVTDNSEDNYVVTLDANDKPLSFLYDDEWEFCFIRKFTQGNPVTTVSFKGLHEDHRACVQRVLGGILTINAHNYSVSTMRIQVSNLTRIIRCLGTKDWTQLDSNSSFRGFKLRLSELSLSAQTIKETASTINKLYDLKLTSRLITRPKKLAKECACINKQVQKQHIAIPESIAKKIFSSAIKTIEEYYPYRSDLSNQFKHFYEKREEYLLLYPEGKPSKFTKEYKIKYPSKINISGFSVSQSASILAEIKTACLIVITGFSGIRFSEASSLNKSSYSVKKYIDMDVPIIKGESSKQQEGGVSKPESWITHPIVEKAIKLAFDMSEYVRQYCQINYAGNPKILVNINSLFVNNNIGNLNEKNLISPHPFYSYFSKIMTKNNIQASHADVKEFDLLNPIRKGELEVGGYLPKLSTHDFRRTFAVFLVRNKLGNVMALKHQYKHLNVFMSQWYANNSELAHAMDISLDTELQELIFESNIVVTTDALFEIYNSPTLSGKEGKRIQEERSKEEYKGSIYMTREEIEQRVRAGKVSIVKHPTGYCFSPSCDRICASNLSSASCEHEAVTREIALSKVPIRERLIKKISYLSNDFGSMANILTSMKLEVEAIEEVLKDHGIKFIFPNNITN